MSWIDAFAQGAVSVFSWPGILIPVTGTLLAMAASFLPGVGIASLAAMLLVLTANWNAESITLLFGALTGGATFMGSITAILFNIPGNVASAPTLLDGFPLASRGYPKTAIACAATASAVGSVIGVIVLVAVLPMIRPLLLEFGPLERLLIGVWGLMTIVAVPTSSILKAMVMSALGLSFAMFGTDPGTGMPRWNFGSLSLVQGFGLIPMMVGLFTLAEIVSWQPIRKFTGDASVNVQEADSIGRGFMSVFRHPGLTIRSSIIGTFIGMVPGVGGTVAGFFAYGQAVGTSRDQSAEFGKGDIRGIIAPEAAVDAKDGGSLFPALAFGLPGSEAGVMLLAAFAMHGIVPGQQVLNNQLPLVAMLILALLLSNILTSVLGIALTPWLVRMRNLPIDRFALPCLIVSSIAVLQLESQLFDIYTMLGFGIFGYYLRRFDWPRVPFVIAFVLGSLVESNFVLTVQLTELGRISLLDQPVSLVLVLIVVASFFWIRNLKTDAGPNTTENGADIVIALVLGLISMGLALIALTGGDSYSNYAKAIVSLTVFLCTLAVTLNAFDWHRQRQVAAISLATRAGKLTPPVGQRRSIFLLILLGPLVALLGISLALGSVSLAWMLLRTGSSADRKAYLTTLLISILIAIGVWYIVDSLLNLVLPPGWLWSLFG